MVMQVFMVVHRDKHIDRKIKKYLRDVWSGVCGKWANQKNQPQILSYSVSERQDAYAA